MAAALLYTQYWSLYLVGVTGLWLLVPIVRNRRHGSWGDAPVPAFLALVGGCVLFLPWVPTFIYQSQHTATPWAAPPNFSAVINAVTGFSDNQGSTLASGTNQGRLLAVVYFAMLALALFGMAKPIASSNSTCTPARARAAPPSSSWAPCSPPLPAASSPRSAFSSRYAAVIFLPLILVIALGTTTLLNPKVRAAVVGVAVIAGLVSSAQNVTTQRTQAGAVAAAINTHAKSGDIIAFCPDQLGPSVYRQVDDTARYDMLTFPRRTGPAIVDWVDYANDGPLRPTRPPSPTIWPRRPAGPTPCGWSGSPATRPTASSARPIAANLSTLATQSGGGARNFVVNRPALFYEPMNLTEFVFAGS